MKVVFIPYGDGRNPYPNLLSAELRKIGIDVIGEQPRGKFSLLYIIFNHWKPDAIHIQWQHQLFLGKNLLKTFIKSVTFILELLLLKVLRIKIVWTVHNIKNHENVYQRTELFFVHFLARLADEIIVHCKTAKTELRKSFSLSQKVRITPISHGNYLNCYENKVSQGTARDKLGLSDRDHVFLFLGLIRYYKGFIELIECFRELNVEQAKLIIAGEPINNQARKFLKTKIDCNKNIIFVPSFIKDDDLQFYINAADVIVFPYRDILSSGGIILSMSFGKPMIAPILGCIPEVIDSIGSFLYNPFKDGALLEAMRKSIDLKSQLKKMGRHNLALAKELKWEDIAQLTYELYRR